MPMISYPPILQGSTYLQLQSLRSYLVQLARELQLLSTDLQASSTLTETRLGAVQSRLSAELKSSASATDASLKSLITRTAGVIQSHIDSIETTLHSDYLALSDFGTYTQSVDARFQQTASGVSEVYSLATATDSDLTSLRTELQGEICRGVITDPDTGQEIVGIAISQRLYFQENALPYIDSDSQTWYRLAPAQTLALYTSTGWQYWINGVRVGWFASDDSSLHLSRAVITNGLALGTGFELISDSSGLGLKFTG